MKKKNGFVFVETMIVTVILIASLLLIYIQYTALISNEKRLARYDDPAFIYKTYQVADFLLTLKDETSTTIIKNKIKENEKSLNDPNENIRNSVYYIALTDEQDLFSKYADTENYNPSIDGQPNLTEATQPLENSNITYTDNSRHEAFFKVMKNELHIQSILLFNNQMIEHCMREGSENKLPSDYKRYLSSIKTGTDNSVYYMVIEYAERVNGEECDPVQLASNQNSDANKSGEKICTRYYSSIKLTEGGI